MMPKRLVPWVIPVVCGCTPITVDKAQEQELQDSTTPQHSEHSARSGDSTPQQGDSDTDRLTQLTPCVDLHPDPREADDLFGGDVDGDGTGDIVSYFEEGACWFVAKGAGSAFAAPTLWLDLGERARTSQEQNTPLRRYLADVTGDGKQDVIWLDGCMTEGQHPGKCYVRVAASDGSRFVYGWSQADGDPPQALFFQLWPEAQPSRDMAETVNTLFFADVSSTPGDVDEIPDQRADLVHVRSSPEGDVVAWVHVAAAGETVSFVTPNTGVKDNVWLSIEGEGTPLDSLLVADLGIGTPMCGWSHRSADILASRASDGVEEWLTNVAWTFVPPGTGGPWGYHPGVSWLTSLRVESVWPASTLSPHFLIDINGDGGSDLLWYSPSPRGNGDWLIAPSFQPACGVFTELVGDQALAVYGSDYLRFLDPFPLEGVWSSSPPDPRSVMSTLAFDVDKDGYGDLVTLNKEGQWTVHHTQGDCLSLDLEAYPKPVLQCFTLRSWHDARADCQARGGDLISVQTSEKLAGLRAGYSAHGALGHIWIGLHDQGTEGSFEWAGGEPLTLDRSAIFSADEPNNSLTENPMDGEDCVLLGRVDNMAGDHSCLKPYAYFCEL